MRSWILPESLNLDALLVDHDLNAAPKATAVVPASKRAGAGRGRGRGRGRMMRR